MWGKTWAPLQLLSKDNEVLVLTEKVDPFSYEERLREQGMFSLRKRRFWKYLCNKWLSLQNRTIIKVYSLLKE